MGQVYTEYDNLDYCVIICTKKGKILYKNYYSYLIFEWEKFPENICQILDALDRLNLEVIEIPLLGNLMFIIKDTTEDFIKKQTFDNGNDIVVYVKNDYISKYNKHFINNFGYPAVENTFLSFVHPEDFEKTYETMLSMRMSLTNRMKKTNGDYIVIQWSLKRLSKKSIIMFGKDITKEITMNYQLETCKYSLNKTESLVTTGILNWDIITKEMEWSDGLKNIFEIDFPDYSKYISCIHKDDIDLVENTVNKCLLNELPYTITYKIITNITKRTKYLKAKGFMFNKRLITVIRDITDDVLNQKTLTELKDTAIKNDIIKTSFIANMSHELRTPLNGIIGITELLKQHKSIGDEKYKEYVDILDNSCGMLLSIINNVLDFSKIEKNEAHIEITRFNIRDFIKENTKIFRFNIENKNLYFNIKIEENVPEYIDTDELKLKQIISNLLSNCLKFTMKGGITVHIFIIDLFLNIEVKDTGIGIEEASQKNIFEPFIQGDPSTTRKYGGTGLGLSICKAYIKLLNGNINFTSKVNTGTTFYISIPLKNLEKNPEETRRNSGYVCIVEDNLSNQYILKEIIEDYSKDLFIKVYDNGQRCIEDLRIDKQPDIIFMDIHMPILDGYKCTTELRNKGFTCYIVGITANHMSNEKEKCLKIGMNDYLLKPIDKTMIHKLLKERLSKYDSSLVRNGAPTLS